MSAADFDPIFQAAGTQYGVDPALLKAQASVESNFNPAAKSDQGAIGLMQMLPTTAKALGVDPTDPRQSIYGAAKLMQENLARYKGDVEQAVSAYHGGTDQANWGPKTQAYVGKVADTFGQIKQSGGYAPAPATSAAPAAPANASQSGAPDPLDAMLSQRAQGQQVGAVPTAGAQPAVSADPLDAMLTARASGQQVGSPAAQPASAAPLAPTMSGGQWKAPGSLLMGAGDIVRGAAQNIVHGLSWAADKVAPDSQFAQDARASLPQMAQTVSTQNQQYAQQRAANGGTGMDLGRATGQALMGAPLAMATPEVGGMLGAIAGGAATGAATNAMLPVDASAPYADQKLGQLATGAITGGIAAPLTRAIGSAISGVGDAAQQRLAQAGVTMTPGQILGGAWARTEDKLSSVPVLGDLIKNAQQRSVQSFNRATYQDALAPIGGRVANDVPVGSDAVAAVRNQIGHVYDSIEPRATFVADQNFGNDLNGIRANLAQTAPGTLPQFDNIVQNQVSAKLAGGAPAQPGGLPIGGVLTGAQWGNTRSEINGIARNQVIGNATPDNRALADALGNLNDAINAGVGRSSPPDILPTLQNANAAWARYKQIEAAAGSAGASNNGNVFTAAQYTNAVRKGSTAAQKAQNSGLNGQLGADAQSVLGSKYPDSGTPGRAAVMGALGLLGGSALPTGIAGPALAAGGLAALPYTGMGQRVGQALLMGRPAGAVPIGDALSRYGVPLAPALGTALINQIGHGQ